MTIIGLLILSLATLLGVAVKLYTFLMLARVLLSWFNPAPEHPVIRFVYRVTTPVLGKAQEFIPATLYQSGIDFSPMLVFLLLILIDTLVVGTLTNFAYTLRYGG